MATHILKLVDDNNNVYDFKVIINPNANPDTYIINEEYTNENLMLDQLTNVIGSDVAFQTAFTNLVSSPDDPSFTQFARAVLFRWSRYATVYGTGQSQGDQWGNDLPYLNTLLHIKGTDPDTRRYVKFTKTTLSDVRNFTVTIYDNDKTTVIWENTRIDIRVWSQYYWYVITNWNDFVEAQTLNDSYNFTLIATSVISGSVATPRFIFSANKNLTHPFDWIWYLFNGEVIPLPEEDDDPYSGDDSPYVPADTGGGDGDGENPYDPGDPNPFPDDPPFSIADTGLMEVYIPTNIQLNLLAGYLWSNNFIDSMVKDLYADPMDVLISLGVLPFYIVAAGTKNIKVGDRDTGVSSSYPRDKYFTLDCGSVQIKSTIGAYIDYAPYTHADIYIPFVGSIPLDIDAFMGHRCGLKYKVEICTGTAVACLMRDNDVWQTFACNMLTPIPLSSANYSQMWQTVVGATATLAGAGLAGAAGMGAAASAGEAAEGAQTISAQSGNAAKASSGIMSAAATKPSIQKSNNVSIMAGILANRKPFILLHRPNLMLPTEQNRYQGYPSYVQTALSSLTGYSRVSSINLSVPSATGEEVRMIDAILKSGFIVGDGSSLSGSGIVLGANTSPTHQIRKHVNVVDTLTGTFRDSVDVLNPVVRIERDNPVGFNYVYISSFGRRYFVEDVTVVRKGILDLHLRVDVLDTFASEILANTAIIDKQEKTYNLYLNDDSIKMRQDPLVTLLKFPNGLFENNQYTFVLCVAGN